MKTMYQKLLLLLLMLPLNVLAQSTVTGNVRDNATGEPLPGVNVIVQGTTNGTATDMDGNFTLSNVNNGDSLAFSFIGFAGQVVTYTGQDSINIILQEDATQLEEVVVIGYGSVRRRDATGSLSNVTAEDFNRGAVVTAENLINGRVAGVTINSTGQPGAGGVIRIRGGASLNAGNDPLLVIDGLPITNSNAGGASSILASLNPNDIESFTVLKDASATAIYGSRASNGVIIITTKKGGRELAVDYNFQYGSGVVANKIDVLSADEFRAQIVNRLPNSVGLLGEANTDWQDEIYRRTDLVDNNINIRGMLFKAIPTRLSVGNTYQEGLRLTNTFNRTTTSLAMNPTFFDNHLKINFNGNFSRERNRYAGAQEGAAIRFDPTQPVRDPDSPFGGFFEYSPGDGTLTGNVARNPVAALLQRRDVSTGNRFYGNFEVDYSLHFLPELRAVVNLGFDQSKFDGSNTVPSNAATGFVQNDMPMGSNTRYWSFRKNRLLDAYLVYKNTAGAFDYEVTGGYSYQKFDSQDFTTQDIINPNAQADINTRPDITLLAFFGRANFSYNNKYLLTLTYRRDGSSRFDKEYRWGNFPAAAFAWKIRDDFFADSSTLSDLKLRLGYGVTGQQDIGDAGYLYLSTYNLGTDVSQIYLGNTPIVIGVPGFYNNEIAWEETTQYNVGLDYGLFNNRITGSVDAFYKESTNLLTYGPVADGANLGNQGFQNVGSFTTKGIEFAIDAAIIDNADVQWNVNFNATHYQRKITELLNNSDIKDIGTVTGGTGTAIGIFREGANPSSFFVYKQLYDTNGNPIEGAYADLNGDNIINGDDRYIFRNADPKVTLGFASNFNYLNFDLYFNLRASIGNRLYNNVNANLAQWDRLQDQSVLGNVPAAVTDSNFNTPTTEVLLSDYYIEDASFLRMDNITLGYTFRKWLNEKTSLRIYTGMQNVFVLTNYSGLDPEVFNTAANSQGIDNTIYPRPRTFLVGANFKF